MFGVRYMKNYVLHLIIPALLTIPCFGMQKYTDSSEELEALGELSNAINSLTDENNVTTSAPEIVPPVNVYEIELMKNAAHVIIDQISKENFIASIHTIESFSHNVHDTVDLLTLHAKYWLEHHAHQLSDEDVQELKEALHNLMDPYFEVVTKLHDPAQKLFATLIKISNKTDSLNSTIKAKQKALIQHQLNKTVKSFEKFESDVNTYFIAPEQIPSPHATCPL